MAERISKQKPAARAAQAEVVEEPATTDSKADLKQELDDLLDEIDGVLEENAEDFVKGYIQKGGQ